MIKTGSPAVKAREPFPAATLRPPLRHRDDPITRSLANGLAKQDFRYSNHYLPVADLYHPSALLRDLRIVGDYDNCPTGLVEGAEQLHYLG